MRTSLASTFLAVLAACDSDPTAMPEEAVCPNLNAANRYAALSLGPTADGAVFYPRARAATADEAAPDIAPGNGSLGVVCGGASDRAACFAKVRSATSAEGWPYALPDGRAANEQDFGVVTKGDDVRIITKPEELGALVAPIESLAEAAALAKFSNRGVRCGTENARTEPDGYVLQYVSGGCGGPEIEYLFKVHRDGSITSLEKNELSSGEPGCIEGRRPFGYVPAPRPWLLSLPAHLAEIAHMEAAAVLAFAELRDDLAAHGAPAALVARIEKARRDEVLHAEIMSARAFAHGATPPPVSASERRPARSLLAIALHNASEGCVRELYGALVAAHQASHARTPALGAAFARIARDEAEHAALSLDVRDWLATRLDASDVARVAAAEEAAWEQLAEECASLSPSADVVREAGMPTASVACALVATLRRALPSAA